MDAFSIAGLRSFAAGRVQHEEGLVVGREQGRNSPWPLVSLSF